MTTNQVLHCTTPLIFDTGLSKRLRRQVMLKFECAQPVGSFKIRGIGLLCQREVHSGAKRLVSSSGGNAGFAVAYAGQKLKVPVSVVIPSTTPEYTRARLAEMDADVVVSGSVWDEADVTARQLSESHGASYIPPFDHPVLWEGHSTIVDEVVASGVQPDAFVVAVGGGGLMCGILEGIKRHALSDTEIVAVETAGAESLHRSVSAGRLITLPRITSLAKSLGAATVASEALAWTRRHPVSSIVVSDRTAVDACFRFADTHRVLVEPACGAALSLLYDEHSCLGRFNTIVVIVCGGIGVTIEQLMSWRHQIRDA